MRYQPKITKIKGFTLIELMVATLIFSIVLVVLLTAFVQISRIFYKGVNMAQTQEDSRTIVQDISDDIKFSQTVSSNFDAAWTPASDSGYFCVGLHRYRYKLGAQLGSGTAYGLARDTISSASGCPSPNPADPGSVAVNSASEEELLDNGMQLNRLKVNCSGGRCLVQVRVVFYGGSPDLFSSANTAYSSNPWQAPDAECTGALSSSQYCAAAEYKSTVLQRS